MNWTISTASGPGYFSPHGFRNTVNLVQIKKDEVAFKSICEDVKRRHAEISTHLDFLARANNVMTQEIRASLRSADPYENVEAVESDIEKMHLASDNQFLRVTFQCIGALRGLFSGFRTLVTTLDPQGLYLPKDGLDGLDKSLEDIHKMHAVVQLNGPALERYVGAVFGVRATKKHIVDYGYEVVQVLDRYNKALVKRHSTDGLEIHGDPVVTDIALSIFENIDAHGEIEAGDDLDRVSAYTRRKAQILARAVGEDPIKGFVRRRGAFLNYLKAALKEAWDWSDRLERVFSKHFTEASQRWDPPYLPVPTKGEFDTVLQHVSDLDPSLVKYRDRAVLLTADERFQNQFMNQTLARMAEIMSGSDDISDALVQYVLERRAELSKRNRDENSFYVCKIGEGNRFKQVPPGMLSVVPGERPKVSLNEIWGSGFDDIRNHIESIEMGAKWHDLFVATSPSRTADKSNVLMIGPQGCGKCVTGDTLVSTSQGLIRIEDLNPGVDEDGYGPLEVSVCGTDGPAESSHFLDYGVNPVIEMTSRHGFSVKGTGKHRLICSGPFGPEWKRLDEIAPGDYVAIVRDDLPHGSSSMDPELAYVLGYYVGDGSPAGAASNPKGLCFAICDLDIEDFERRCFPTIQKHIGNPNKYPASGGRACFNVQVWKTEGRAKEIYEACGRGCANKRVPDSVLKSGLIVWKNFLQGLFDADGSAYGRRVELSSNSRELIRTVQVMLLHFGVISMVQNKASKPKAWRLFIYGENLRKFAKEVGFGHARKTHKLLEACETTVKNGNYDVVPVDKESWLRLKEQCSPLPREVHKSMDHYYRGGHFPGHDVLARILDTVPDCEAKASILDLADPRYFWDRVESVVPAGEEPVFDLTVPKGESFAANGLMNHNSQVLRAVGADRGSVSVFAQGSDFLTCWLGEAEKNPKRMFEEAARLQKESGKHVYILIDEADSVMKKQEEKRHGEVDLTLEFQICMDGVIHYPKLTVVAATNSPARMPMTMIRRFSKVLIVGELVQADRERVLKHYVGFMPTDGFEDRHWTHAAMRLDGATGDVIRKVIDHIWREKMTWFVKHQPERAEEMLKWLNSDVRFDISEFDKARRGKFKHMLGPHVRVSPSDLDKSVDAHLKNVGIQGEIRTAKAVYKEAHELLDSLDSSGLIVTS